MKNIEIRVQVTPSFVQVFNFSPGVAVKALVEWVNMACVGEEITVKVAEKEESVDE